MLVISVLLPPGLDYSPASTPSPTDKPESRRRKTDLAEARLILDTVQRWAAPYDLAVVLGDMNCTIIPGLDRGTARIPAVSPLSESILSPSSSFTDAFRFLHPHLHCWTRERARIDYALVKCKTQEQVRSCDIDWGFPSDHAGLECCIDIGRNKDSPKCHGPEPRAFDLHRASDEQRDRFRLQGNEMAGKLLSQLRVDCEGVADTERLLRTLEALRRTSRQASWKWPEHASLPQRDGKRTPGNRPSDYGCTPCVGW